MDRTAFMAAQEKLRERLLHAVPRSARATALQAELQALVNEELRREMQSPSDAPTPVDDTPEPPADLFDRTGDREPFHRSSEPYGGNTPYWVEQ